MAMKTARVNRAVILTSIAGILLSTYAFYVEMAVEVKPGYKAACDISEYASCSRVLTSKYAKGFGIIPDDSPLKVPNCIYGIAFYCLIIYLSTYDHIMIVRLQFLCVLSSMAASVYLAYLLTFVLRDICVVCISTYCINGFLVYYSFKKIKCLSVKNE